jgi:hypothetical protein
MVKLAAEGRDLRTHQDELVPTVDRALEDSSTTNEPINVTVTTPPTDFGDAPDTAAGTSRGNYQTLATDNGPRHTIISGLKIGASVDADNGISQNAAANADDVNGALPDDEDGLTNPAVDLVLTVGMQPKVNVRVTNTTGTSATLYGWIDYNADGVFDNATERASMVVPSGSNIVIQTLVFPVVPGGYWNNLCTVPPQYGYCGRQSDRCSQRW